MPKDLPPAPPGKTLPNEKPKAGAQPAPKKHADLRAQRTKAVKAVKVCPKCGAYMLPAAHFGRDGESASFANDNHLRSFGGVEVRGFECEKCHYTAHFQVDPFPKHLGEEPDIV
jgi:ribosomal protein S27AE